MDKKEGTSFKKISSEINKLKANKNVFNLFIVFLVGILILVITSFFNPSVETMKTVNDENISNEQSSGSESISNETLSNEEVLNKELKTILTKIDGVGEVEVMIYFESGEEQVPAINENNSTSVTNEKDDSGGTRDVTQSNNGNSVVTTTNGSATEPLILKKVKPEISGIVIVAEGAEFVNIKLDIIDAVSTLFNIDDFKVKVYAMKR